MLRVDQDGSGAKLHVEVEHDRGGRVLPVHDGTGALNDQAGRAHAPAAFDEADHRAFPGSVRRRGLAAPFKNGVHRLGQVVSRDRLGQHVAYSDVHQCPHRLDIET
jgi:hypothetical protein